MNVEEFREYCIDKPGVTEGFPFTESVLVFKVMNKMFALADIDEWDGINLKCDPDEALELRASFDAVEPGYHMSKVHWNTVRPDMDASDSQIYKWIDDSYNLIVASLPKKLKEELEVIIAQRAC